MVQKVRAWWDHEQLRIWLFSLLYVFTNKKQIGITGGPQTAVRIDDYNGRLPDLFCVRQEQNGILQQDAIYGAPDLILEIIAPNDQPSNMSGLEVH